jgi:C4-type Zn-finger protein
LGTVRSKFSSIPIPGAEVTLDGSDLRTQAATEKEQLITQIKEMLEATSRRSLLEAKKDETEFLESTLNRVPMPIYIG